MNFFEIVLFFIIIFEYEFIKIAASLKLSPPWISVVRNVGENYSIKCEGKGQKRWRNGINGQFITNDRSKSSVFTEIGHSDDVLILRFSSIRKENKGVYNCSSKVDKNGQYSVGFELIVIQPVTLISNEKTEVIILKEGDDVTLECNTEGQPPPIISWFFNGKLTNVSEGEEKSSLPIRDVSPRHDGTYTCRAFQKLLQTQDVELSFKIKVYQKPDSLSSNFRFENVTVVYGFRNESRNLTCAVKAYPAAYFVWYKDDHLLQMKKNVIKVYNDENISTLEILLEDFSVLGIYECEAANPHGHFIQKIKYALASTPQTPRLCYFERNDTSAIISVYLEPFPIESFTCKIEYSKFTWHKGEEKWKTARVLFCSSQRMPNTNKIHCKIQDLQPLTKYAVRAALRNPGGFGNYSNEIIFRTRSESSNSVSLKITNEFVLFGFVTILLAN